MSDRRPCSGCAFTPGTPAHEEPHNALRAEVSTLAGLPFYCHDTDIADWRDDAAFKAAILTHQPIPVCAGWVRAVRELAERGYFRKRPEIVRLRRQLGAMAMRAINEFCDRDADEYTKMRAKEDLETALGILTADDAELEHQPTEVPA